MRLAFQLHTHQGGRGVGGGLEKRVLEACDCHSYRHRQVARPLSLSGNETKHQPALPREQVISSVHSEVQSAHRLLPTRDHSRVPALWRAQETVLDRAEWKELFSPGKLQLRRERRNKKQENQKDTGQLPIVGGATKITHQCRK